MQQKKKPIKNLDWGPYSLTIIKCGNLERHLGSLRSFRFYSFPSWLELRKDTLVASFSVSWDKFHSTCKPKQIVQRLIWFETYLIVVLVLGKVEATLICIYDFHKTQIIFTLYTVLFLLDKIWLEHN